MDFQTWTCLFLVCGYVLAVIADRPGNSTKTDSCTNVREVPEELRNAANIGPSGLAKFYQRYTEAYGIPVIASANVPDDALRRACYVLRFMLADHAAVRESYYKKSGRVAIIGKKEKTTDIPEHSFLDDSWNARARGLGATESAPVSTGGEENVMCHDDDKYKVEDIFLHEFAHGIHLLGAKHAIPGWEKRLDDLYAKTKGTDKWKNTYAMSTSHEYFAEGTQSYFNVNGMASPPNGIHNHVNTREKLMEYDPELFNLIKEVFPCGNVIIDRCVKDREKEATQLLSLKMDCAAKGTRAITDPLKIKGGDLVEFL